MSDYVSYADAAFVAIGMIEGTNPKAFYDEIPSRGGKTNMLNYKGVSLLAGIMGVSVVSIEETDESDESEVVVKAEALSPNGNKGYAWLSRPKQDRQNKDDEDFREKVYTHAKRNAMRDLVPYQLFLELLMMKSAGKDVPSANPVQPSKADPLEQAKEKARETIREERDNLKNLHAISAPDVIEHMESDHEKGFGKKQAEWTPSQWIEFIKALKDPVAYGVETAYEEETSSDGNDPEPEETPEQTAKDELEKGNDSEDSEEEDELPDIEPINPKGDSEEDSEADGEADNANQLQMLLDEVDNTTEKK